ncbi:MAG: helix-turn-helix domain-containing protein [Candidatus Dormibacteraeota bacterium]|uniref:Helix-turn-helix domain-containing protein n=1 Tax=Candidatus Dormiibacter inghamiae TaxID=3127013 RepID=A0A934NG82_9BACT|nr:helix-turn-helix domain-containing protein [Candidatus Dormibacteraeota bacterium]MBJ7605276.1 helix-turn-helix domain-containing protein [Candidatus Dormibacteraeota bacterium]
MTAATHPAARSATEGLTRLVTYLAGNASVAIDPYEEELTTQEAADLLGVSRTYFVRLIEDKRMVPYETVGLHGKHRRVRLRDVLASGTAAAWKRSKADGKSSSSLGRDRSTEYSRAIGSRDHLI